MNNVSQEVVEFDMDDNTEKIVDALSLVSEEYLVPVEEIAATLKILNRRFSDTIQDAPTVFEAEWKEYKQ